MEPAAPEGAYVLATAARNEADAIEATMAAVGEQTKPPAAWVIVSDGSTDATDDLVQMWTRRLPFLSLLRIDRDGPASFAAKALAVRAGYAHMAGIDHEFVGNLDADVAPAPDYYERLVELFWARPDLGITGGVVVENLDGDLRGRRENLRSVPGAGQFFRRQCWEQLGGGYLAIEGGGEDALAEVVARANGWEVAAVADLELVHHGPVLGGATSRLQARLARGRMNWCLGYRADFQAASALRRVADPPAGIGSLATLVGYGMAAARRVPRTAPPEVVEYLRADQRARMRRGMRAVVARAPSATR